MRRITPLSIREVYLSTLTSLGQVTIAHRNAKLEVYEQTDHTYNWRCDCGARGHGGRTPRWSASLAIEHVERIHPDFELDDPSAHRAHEDSLKIPDVYPNVETTDDATSDNQVDQQSSQRPLMNVLIDNNVPLDTFRFIQSRWELFSDDELVALNQSIRALSFQIRDSLATKLRRETCREMVARNIPIHGSCD